MKLYQLYNYIKGSIWINWYLGQMWQEAFIEHANTALLYVTSYLGRKRSHQLITQAATNYDVDDDKTFYYRTSFPIVNGSSVQFYCSEQEVIEKTSQCDSSLCMPYCPWHIDLSCCDSCCDCCEDKRIDMEYVQPWTPLKPWDDEILVIKLKQSLHAVIVVVRMVQYTYHIMLDQYYLLVLMTIYHCLQNM